MRYVKEIAVIFGITMAGEFLNDWIPLPIPAGVYGLFLLLGLLCSGLLKVSDVQAVGGFLLDTMPLMFIPAAVGLIDQTEAFRPVLAPMAVMIVVSTLFVMAVTGKTTEWVLKNRRREDA